MDFDVITMVIFSVIIFVAIFLGIFLSNFCIHIYRQWSMKRFNEENLKRVEIVESDNRDVYTTDLILDNGTVVEVDVQDLFENMIENVSEDTVEDYSVEELLDMFKILKDKINA